MEIQNVIEQRKEEMNNYLNMKWDMEEIDSELFHLKDQFIMRSMSQGRDISIMGLILDKNSTAYIAPAFNYNKLIDAVVRDVFWDDIKYTIKPDDYVPMKRRECYIIGELQNCLISIKIALDRLVKMFAIYYRGISAETTFGHINLETGSAKGFMSFVKQNREGDAFLEYIHKEYQEWIYDCVQPRDTIVHYDDIVINYHYDGGLCALIPTFMYKKKKRDYETDLRQVSVFVNRFYCFYRTVIQQLFDRDETI